MWIAIGIGGEVSYGLVEPNNFESSKSQSLVSRSLGLDKTSRPPLVALDLYRWSLNHSLYNDLSVVESASESNAPKQHVH